MIPRASSERAKRLPAPRLAGIVAWTAASVTWSTVIVAVANAFPSQAEPVVTFDEEPEVTVLSEAVVEAALPAMPTSGLIVMRYTPSEKPAPERIVRTVVRSTGSGSSSKPAKTKSSGSK